MINHVRTLLLNKSDTGAGLSSGDVGSEFIAHEFAPLNLPAALSTFRRILLPDGQTAYQHNYRLAGLMKILHMPELEDYTLMFDKRFTYVFEDDYLAQLRASAVAVNSSVSSDSDAALVYNYNHTLRWEQSGTQLTWALSHEATDDNSVSVTLNGGASQTLQLSFQDGRTQDIVLVPDYLSVYFTEPNGTLNGKFRFDVLFQPTPVFNIADVLENIAIADARTALAGLVFGDWAAYTTELSELYDLWRFSRESSVRLGAAMLGYAIKCEQLHQGSPLSVASTTLRRYE